MTLSSPPLHRRQGVVVDAPVEHDVAVTFVLSPLGIGEAGGHGGLLKADRAERWSGPGPPWEHYHSSDESYGSTLPDQVSVTLPEAADKKHRCGWN